MTEEDKAALREKKAQVIVRLNREKKRIYKFKKFDERLHAYLKDNICNPNRHNLYELCSVESFLKKEKKYGLNKPKVRIFYNLYESLKFPGLNGYQSYTLTPVQCFQFANIEGFWQDGRRVVREVCLFVPRKFSKTTSVASLAINDLLYGDNNAEIYFAANSQDQAHKGFDVIRNAAHFLDPQESIFQINKEIVKYRFKEKPALAQCLTSNARTKDGLNASTILMDEFSQADDSELLTVLTTSMGMRNSPLTVIITTASDKFEGPFFSMLQGYKRVLLGELEDDSLFAHLFEPDVDDDEGDPKTWRKVQPHMGVTVREDFYETEWKKAQRDGAEAMLAFRTKLLNVYSENEQRAWITSKLIRDISQRIDVNAIVGRPAAYVSFDLSVCDDLSAVTFGMYTSKPSHWTFHTAYFFPRGALAGHCNESMFRAWAEAGYLNLCDGPVIDYKVIVEYIHSLNDRVRILGIGYDRYKAEDAVNMLRATGAAKVVQDVSQTYGNFTSAVETFEHGAKTGMITIDDNPINAYCFGNAVLDYDRLENCKPIKRRHDAKIDGCITVLMCIRQFLDGQQAVKRAEK